MNQNVLVRPRFHHTSIPRLSIFVFHELGKGPSQKVSTTSCYAENMFSRVTNLTNCLLSCACVANSTLIDKQWRGIHVVCFVCVCGFDLCCYLPVLCNASHLAKTRRPFLRGTSNIVVTAQARVQHVIL